MIINDRSGAFVELGSDILYLKRAVIDFITGRRFKVAGPCLRLIAEVGTAAESQKAQVFFEIGQFSASRAGGSPEREKFTVICYGEAAKRGHVAARLTLAEHKMSGLGSARDCLGAAQLWGALAHDMSFADLAWKFEDLANLLLHPSDPDELPLIARLSRRGAELRQEIKESCSPR